MHGEPDPAMSVAATTSGAADETSPGTSSSPARGAPPARRSRSRAHRDAAGGLEHPLGVVARRHRLEHGRSRRRGPGARRADRRLHLRARDGRLVARRASAAPRSPAGVAVRGLDAGAHAAAASATRSIGRRESDSSPVSSKRRPSCPASRPGSRRMSVPAFPRRSGRTARGARGRPEDAQRVVVLVDRGAERARPRRSSTRCRPERPKPAIRVSALADRAEQHRAMRDRLVPGHRDVPRDRGGRLDLHSPSPGADDAVAPVPRGSPPRELTRRRPRPGW